MMVRFKIAELAGSSILSGAPSGQRLFTKLVGLLPAEPLKPTAMLLDFGEIEVVTASFLREAIFEFRTFVRSRKSNFYPVIANANSEMIDEILELVHSRHDVIMTCKIDDEGVVLRCQYIGKLDPMQKVTFDLVNMKGETTATKLRETQTDEVKITAWNNRLASLSNLGLIFEQSHGRTKSYKPIFWEGSKNGR